MKQAFFQIILGDEFFLLQDFAQIPLRLDVVINLGVEFLLDLAELEQDFTQPLAGLVRFDRDEMSLFKEKIFEDVFPLKGQAAGSPMRKNVMQAECDVIHLRLLFISYPP